MKSKLFWTGLFGLLFLLATAVLGVAVARLAEDSGLAAVDDRLQSLAPWFLGFRFALMAIVIGGWGYGIAYLARRYQWPTQRAEFMLGLRWRVAVWFVVMETLLIQGGFGALARQLVG